MKNKSTLPIVLAVLNVIACLVMNFQEFLMGSPATIKNLIVTSIYIIIWIFIITITTKSKNHGVMKVLYVFWILTMIASILTAFVNITKAQVDWVIPLAILLLGQWYGFIFFVESYMVTSIIVAVISIIMIIIPFISFRRGK